MIDFPRVGIRSGAPLQGLCILLIAVALVGCANFRRLRKNLKQMEQTSTVSGRVAAGDWKGGPIDVYLFDVDARVEKPVRVSQFQTLEEPGKYSFSVRPGYYMIGAAEDVDGDGELGAGEPHALYNDFEILNVASKSKRSRLNMELSEERAQALDRMAAEDVPVDYELHTGDLLAARLVRDQVDAGTDRYVGFLATIASPLAGIPSADTGVKMAPQVVPSWRDVGPKSEFIQSLFDRPFPPDIEYALYFGFGSSSKKSKQGTDGTVLVRNALPREAQDAATVVSGFAETHTGILVNRATVQQLNEDMSALCLAGD